MGLAASCPLQFLGLEDPVPWKSSVPLSASATREPNPTGPAEEREKKDRKTEDSWPRKLDSSIRIWTAPGPSLSRTKTHYT